jgi:hypothetical protein
MTPARTLSVSISRPPDEVYRYASNPENLPRWASGLCLAVRHTPSGWVVDTPQGPMGLRFVEANGFGVLDHYVRTAPGVEVYVPMRVVANGAGSELLLTVFRLPDMTDAQFAGDLATVERDLRTLKSVLEG